MYPAEGYAYVAVFPDATIVCDHELVTVPADGVPRHVLDFAAAGRPAVMFGQDSGAGALAFAEWVADGTLIRSYDGELDYELADSVAREMFGFAVEGGPGDGDKGEVVVHGFRVTRPDQAERDAEMEALVARMVQQGPTRMTFGPDGSLISD